MQTTQNVDSNNRKIGPPAVDHGKDKHKPQYRDNVTVDGVTFNGNKFRHKLYYQNGATKEEVEQAIRAREPSAQRASLRIYQGVTNEQAVSKQKQVDASRKAHPSGRVVEAKAKAKAPPPPVARPALDGGPTVRPSPTPEPSGRSHWYSRDNDTNG